MLKFLAALDQDWSDEAGLSLLRKLTSSPGSGSSSDPPHKPLLQHLQKIDLSNATDVAPAHLKELARFPALTSLEPLSFVADSLAMINPATFPHLRCLSLRVDSNDDMPVRKLLPTLCANPALTTLHLSDCIFSLSDLADLATALPLLQTLEFTRIKTLSLSGLCSLAHLHTLTFNSCPGVTAGHLCELKPLSSLRTLNLLDCHHRRSTPFAQFEAVLAVLTLPSAQLPQLTHVEISSK
jgi:hypothetical protein